MSDTENLAAVGGEEEQPLTELEIETLQKLFSSMGARPKTESKEDLRQWLTTFKALQPPATTTPLQPPAITTAAATPMVTAHQSTSANAGPASAASGLYVSSASAPPTVVNVLGRKPWLMKFSGDDGYDLWRHQLLSLIQERHRSQDLADAIRASLQGKAAALLISLGPQATVEAILAKLDSVYGQVDDSADVMASFFSARQASTETVADWSCRIEGLFGRVQRLSATTVSTEDLRQMFWTGLRQELKDASSFHYETVKDFDNLRKVLRRIEKQHPPQQQQSAKSGRNPCNAVQKERNTDTTETLIAMVKQLSSEFQAFKKESASRTEAQRPPPFADHRDKLQTFGAATRGGNAGSGYSARGQQHPRGGPRGRGGRGPAGPVFCYKCGEPGHIQIGCRVNTDHLRRPHQGF